MINLLYIIVIGKPLESSSLEYDANSTDTNTLSSKYFKTNGQKNNKIHHKPMQGSLLNYVQGMTDATKLKHVTIRNTIQRGKEKDNIQYGLEGKNQCFFLSFNFNFNSSMTTDRCTNDHGNLD